MEVRSELVWDIQYLVHLQRAANAQKVEGRTDGERERGQRGESNTVDAHETPFVEVSKCEGAFSNIWTTHPSLSLALMNRSQPQRSFLSRIQSVNAALPIFSFSLELYLCSSEAWNGAWTPAGVKSSPRLNLPTSRDVTKLKLDRHLQLTSAFSNLTLRSETRGGCPLLTLGLWYCNAWAVCDKQVHDRVTGDIDSGCCNHVAKGDRAAGGHIRGDRVRGNLAVAVGAHVALELRGRLAVDTTQVADENTTGGRAAKAPWTLLPLLAVVLLGVNTKVCQRGEAWRMTRVV